MIDVIWLSMHPQVINKGYYDTALLEHLFDGILWQAPHMPGLQQYEADHISEGIDGAVVILPARHHKDDVAELNKQIKHLKWVLLILCGDEAAEFPYTKLNHPNVKIWVMTPRLGVHDGVDRFIGDGWPPDCHKLLPVYSKEAQERPLDICFMGQVTHERRQQCVEQMRLLLEGDTAGLIHESPGFTQGLSHEEYYKTMASSKIVMCPSGPETPDTFRSWEALEAGCIPILDDITPGYDSEGYWNYLLGDHPMPVIKDWSSLPGYVDELLKGLPANLNRITAWWLQYKRQLVYNMRDDISELTGEVAKSQSLKDKITVLIPCSPIKSHPGTDIIEQTINSVRHHLPTCEIIVMADGVRTEQESRRSDYEEFLRILLWKCQHEWSNTLVKIFDDHSHQVKMLKETLNEDVNTDLIFWAEADTPLCDDFVLPLDEMCDAIYSGEVSSIRFSHESLILPDHRYLMLDEAPITVCGVPLIRTVQYSARPQLASVAFYRRLLEQHSTPNTKSFVEDLVHSPIQVAYQKDGVLGWQEYRLSIYHPKGGNIKRSFHTDGRAGAEKYDSLQVFR